MVTRAQKEKEANQRELEEAMKKQYLESICDQKESIPVQVSVLQEANEIIYGDREKTYGAPNKNLNMIADYWSVHLSSKYDVDIQLTPDDVCGMMILMKQARLANDPTHRDSLVDICGYSALQERVRSGR